MPYREIEESQKVWWGGKRGGGGPTHELNKIIKNNKRGIRREGGEREVQ